jgi:hypothetical protein
LRPIAKESASHGNPFAFLQYHVYKLLRIVQK